MLWWIIALLFFIAWAAGLDLVGFIVLCLIFVMVVLGSLAGVDHRRHKQHSYHLYHPSHPE